MDEEKNRVTEWYNSWLNNRKPIFIKNRKSIGLNPEGTQEMINGQINRIKTTPLYIDNDVPDSVYDSLKTPLSLLYGKNTTKNSLAQDYKDTNIYGVSSFSGEGPFMYFPDNSSKKQ